MSMPDGYKTNIQFAMKIAVTIMGDLLNYRLSQIQRDDGDGRVGVYGSGSGVKNTVTIVTTDTWSG